MLFIAKKTFAAAREVNAILIIQVKDNQETLRKQLGHGMKIQKPIDRFKSEWECAHSRIEQRIYEGIPERICFPV